MLFWSGWLSLSKTLAANRSVGTGFMPGTHNKIIDKMFRFQVIAVKVVSLEVAGVGNPTGTPLLLQGQNLLGGQIFRHNRGRLWDFGMVPVNKR